MKKLETIEMARGLAAVAVVAFHTNTAAYAVGLAITEWAAPLRLGVDFFFVLSGFIIFHVHRGDIGQREKAWPYFLKRCIRLFPVLWMVAGSWIVLRAILGSPTSAEAIGTTMLLYPSLTEPVPPVVWTLRHELLFYLAFALMVFSRRIGVTVFAIWTLAVLVQMGLIAAGRPIEGPMSMVLSSYVLDFVFGAVAAFLASKWKLSSWWPLTIGLVLLAVCFWLDVNWMPGKSNAMDYVHHANLYLPINGFVFGLIVFGLVAVEDKVNVPRWGVVLGAASYAIYLIHVIVNSFSQIVASWLGNGTGHVLIFVSGIAAGLVLHFGFEKPVTRKLRTLLLPARSAPLPSGKDNG